MVKRQVQNLDHYITRHTNTNNDSLTIKKMSIYENSPVFGSYKEHSHDTHT